jgi:hypothetical protein
MGMESLDLCLAHLRVQANRSAEGLAVVASAAVVAEGILEVLDTLARAEVLGGRVVMVAAADLHTELAAAVGSAADVEPE